jgi:hypothetical protein
MNEQPYQSPGTPCDHQSFSLFSSAEESCEVIRSGETEEGISIHEK